MVSTTPRYCWECRRRRLVCDSSFPECKKCVNAGVPCSGYGDKKPIRIKWLAPGKVQSKTRKTKKQQDVKRHQTTHDQVLANSSALTIAAPRVEQFAFHSFYEASMYYNAYLGPDLRHMQEITPHLGITVFTPEIFKLCLSYPDHVRMVVICSCVIHRIGQSDEDSRALRRKFLQYRGIMIESLRKDLNKEDMRQSGSSIVGSLFLLMTDLQYGHAHTSWRCHLDAIRIMISMRGGIRVLSNVAGLRTILHTFMLFAILGDTTSPASDLIVLPEHIEDYKFLITKFGKACDFRWIFPSPLLIETIKINYLRKRVAACNPPMPKEFVNEALEILSNILNFSPQDWAREKSHPREEDLALLGGIYQSAVASYCISSLQSLSVLPQTASLIHNRAKMSQRLLAFLEKAMAAPRFRKFIYWPMAVLGMEAVNGDAAMRTFVQEKSVLSTRFCGTILPRTAKAVVEKFWASGKTDWDSCFDKPYMFYCSVGVDGAGYED